MRNYITISSKTHVLSVKLDGVRSLMIVMNNNVYLLGRDMKCRHICRTDAEDAYYDVEVMIDSLTSSLVYVVLDCVPQKFMSRDEWGMCFNDRLLWIQEHVPLLNIPEVIVQEYFPVDRVDLSLEVVNIEGLVFTPLNHAYMYGYSGSHYKWKNTGDTADLMLKEVDGKYCLVSVGYVKGVVNNYKVEGFLTDQECERFKGANIIECSYGLNKWHPVKFRLDKEVPNATHIVHNVILSCNLRVPVTFLYTFTRRFVSWYIRDKIVTSYKQDGYDARLINPRVRRSEGLPFLCYAQRLDALPEFRGLQLKQLMRSKEI